MTDQPKFTGVKKVIAHHMSLGMYNEYRGDEANSEKRANIRARASKR